MPSRTPGTVRVEKIRSPIAALASPVLLSVKQERCPPRTLARVRETGRHAPNRDGRTVSTGDRGTIHQPGATGHCPGRRWPSSESEGTCWRSLQRDAEPDTDRWASSGWVFPGVYPRSLRRDC